MIKNVHRSSRKVPVIIGRFQCNLNFLNTFSKNAHISNLMKIRPVGVELFHADRWTDRHDEANSRSSQFCERVYKGRKTSKHTVLSVRIFPMMIDILYQICTWLF